MLDLRHMLRKGGVVFRQRRRDGRRQRVPSADREDGGGAGASYRILIRIGGEAHGEIVLVGGLCERTLFRKRRREGPRTAGTRRPPRRARRFGARTARTMAAEEEVRRKNTATIVRPRRRGPIPLESRLGGRWESRRTGRRWRFRGLQKKEPAPRRETRTRRIPLGGRSFRTRRSPSLSLQTKHKRTKREHARRGDESYDDRRGRGRSDGGERGRSGRKRGPRRKGGRPVVPDGPTESVVRSAGALRRVRRIAKRNPPGSSIHTGSFRTFGCVRYRRRCRGTNSKRESSGTSSERNNALAKRTRRHCCSA